MAMNRIRDMRDRWTGRELAPSEFQDLIRQAREGSAAAQGRLLEPCRRFLLLLAQDTLDSDLRPKAGASDIVQDTFLDAHRDFSSFQGSTEFELYAWLTQILKNQLANNVRHYRGTQKRDVAREIPIDADTDKKSRDLAGPYPSPEQEVIACDEAAKLKRALAELPHAMGRVLLLRTWERQTFSEIAAELGGTPDSVRKLWGRALVRLQAVLAPDQ